MIADIAHCSASNGYRRRSPPAALPVQRREDALNSDWMVGAEEHYLTQSWRFGPAIAHVANIILSYKGETRKLQGLGPQTLVKSPSRRTFLTALSFTAPLSASSKMPCSVCNPVPKFYWVGGIDSYCCATWRILYAFSRGLRQNVQKKAAPGLPRLPQYGEIAEISQDSECSLDQDHLDLP